MSLFYTFIDKINQFIGFEEKNCEINVFLVDAPMAGAFIEFGIFYSDKLGIPSLLCLAHEYLHIVLSKKFKQLLFFEVSEIMEENLINKIIVETGLWNDLILNSSDDVQDIKIEVPLFKLDENTEKMFTAIIHQTKI